MITQAYYKEMTDLIDDAQSRGDSMVYYLNKMKTDLSNSEIEDDNIHGQKVDDQIDATIDVITDRNSAYTYYILTFVKILQNYITINYGSVNDFIRDGDIQVKAIFADVSETVGYPIHSSLIENIS